VAPVLGVLLLGSCLAALAGVASAGGDVGGGATPAVAPARPATSPHHAATWAQVLGALDERRAAAFAAGALPVLARVYTPGSPAGARDRASLDRLVTSGSTAHGVRPAVLSAVAVSPRDARPDGPDSRVVLSVVDRLPVSYVVDVRGGVTRASTRSARRWLVTMARVTGEWRVVDVRVG
jgi:hypothetical protein